MVPTSRSGGGVVTRTPNTGYGPSLGLTLGGRGNRYAGYLHIGAGRGPGAGLYGALYFDGRHRRYRHRYYHYGYGHYYRHYRPIYYYGCDYYYRPYYGYTYASIYFPAPYVYRFYDGGVYYINQGPDAGASYEQADRSAVDAQPLPTDITYMSLTQPGDTTLIGQGNGAFVAGQYEQARRFYVSAMLADERDGYAKFLYALANFALADYEVAGMAIRRALITTPELMEFPVDVRSLYRHPDVLETQIQTLIRFMADHPQDRGAMLLLSYIQYAAGDADRALNVLDRLLEADPDDSVATLLRDAVLRVARGKKPAG